MTRVYIYLKPSFKEKVQGLCGNYDGDIQNDYSHGDMIFEDAIQFGQSWNSDSDICPLEKSPENINAPSKEQDMCNAVSLITLPQFSHNL